MELITTVFGLWYPNVKDIGELDKGERAAWIRIREGVLQGHKAVIEALKTTVKALDRQVDAEIEDRRERRAEEFKDRAARRRRKNQAHDQTMKERQVKLANQSLAEKLLITMTAISFLCAICLVIAGFLTGQVFAYGSGGALGVIGFIGMIRFFVLGKDRISFRSEGDAASG